MPFYRNPLGGPGFMHVKFARGVKAPPACCARVGIRGYESRCGVMAGNLCDWPVDGGGTCDAPICDAHATEVGKNRHYCQIHTRLNREQQPDLFAMPHAITTTGDHDDPRSALD